MTQIINRRDVLRTGLFASGGLVVLTQCAEAARAAATSKEQANKAIVRAAWAKSIWPETRSSIVK